MNDKDVQKVKAYVKLCEKRVLPFLEKNLPSPTQSPKILHKAMRYAVLNGGKRLRTAFIYAIGDALGADHLILGNLAAAIEIMHAFILVHDDLPAIDNDDLRRGKPSCHVAFGESTAILTGDALLVRAFEIIFHLDQKKVSAKAIVEMSRLMAAAEGSLGQIGGEYLDVEMVDQSPSIKSLEKMYYLKTGIIFSLCISLCALAANYKNKKTVNNLIKSMDCIGVAFQIHDDIIGIESDEKVLGKRQGADVEMNKPTYPLLVGMINAKKREQVLFKKACSYLDKTKLNVDILKMLIAYLIERKY